MAFVHLSDLAGKSSKAQFGNWSGGCDAAITEAVKSGNGALFKQAVADWAKSGQMARATAATPVEVEAYFARPDVATFASTIWNNVLAGQSPNVAGQQWPQPIFDVKDPNTPSISKCGETFVAVAVPVPAPSPVSAFPSAPPPSSSYTPAPSYAASPTYAAAPAPSYAPEPSYAPPPRSRREYPIEQPAGPNMTVIAAVAGGALLIVAALILKKSSAPAMPPQPYPQYAQPYPPYPQQPYPQPPMVANKRRRR